MLTFREFPSRHALEQYAVELLETAFAEETAGPNGVMLTGGKTPLTVYQRLAERPLHAGKTLHLLVSDERHVAPGSRELNYAHIAPLGAALKLPDTRLLRVDTTCDLDDAADRYARTLEDFLLTGRIALGILGLGADGHLASLFTDSDVQSGAGRLAVAVKRSTPPHRISVTPDLLRRVQRLVFWVEGKEKADILRKLRRQPESVLAGRVVRDYANAECWFSVKG